MDLWVRKMHLLCSFLNSDYIMHFYKSGKFEKLENSLSSDVKIQFSNAVYQMQFTKCSLSNAVYQMQFPSFNFASHQM